MTKVSQKHYFLIVVAVCFLFSSVANAFVMYSHSMADNMSEHTSSEHTSSVVNEPHSSEKLHHHSSHRDSSHSHHHDPIVMTTVIARPAVRLVLFIVVRPS